ncbi:STAS domain-containing protein [Actinoallomurus sp. NPDC052274]|uniref:STAS domain-containing protein n=1 Tax=Actinoallomurus sp. NPDC052274 TaxID=3155420 RepID=UPI0034354A3F
MTTPLTLTPDRRPDGTPVLTAVGEIDMSNSADLAAAVADGLEGAAGPLIVDLTDVEYLDSAGLSILLTHADRIEVVATPLLAPVLTFCGLTDLTTIHGLGPADPAS